MTLIGRARRLLETARHLRPVQIFGRVWFRLYRPAPDLRAAPGLRSGTVGWQACARLPSMTAGARLRFHEVEHDIVDAADWNHSRWPRLWLYNLHYFDDLAADDAASRATWQRELIKRWIAENPPGQGVGWEPYPTSLRLVNWIKWSLAGNTLDGDSVHSLAVQARWLRQRLEVHLLGNHLLANAKALVFCGAFFQGEEAARWLAKGVSLLRRELAEQVLADGGHFERSAMYHAVVLEDVLDLCQMAGCYPGVFDERDVAHWRQLSQRMLRWLQVMSHPDGEIAFFNDAAMAIAPTLATLSDYARALGITPWDAPLAAIEVLPDSGFVRIGMGAAVLIADVGSVGPGYLPGHAHAGTLSFELSVHGQRLVVNSGTSTYELGNERHRQRGTAAHSTVKVAGRNSSEVWAGFRVARRARVQAVRCVQESSALVLEAAHDGYRRQGVSGLHHRRWRMDAHGLEVSDRLDDDAGGIVRLHLHPQVAPSVQGRYVLIAGHAQVRVGTDSAKPLQIRESSWHPRFGVASNNYLLEGVFTRQCCIRIDWTGDGPTMDTMHPPVAEFGSKGTDA